MKGELGAAWAASQKLNTYNYSNNNPNQILDEAYALKLMAATQNPSLGNQLGQVIGNKQVDVIRRECKRELAKISKITDRTKKQTELEKVRQKCGNNALFKKILAEFNAASTQKIQGSALNMSPQQQKTQQMRSNDPFAVKDTGGYTGFEGGLF